MKKKNDFFFGVRMKDEDKEKLDVLASTLGVSSGEVVRRLIRGAKVSSVPIVSANLGVSEQEINGTTGETNVPKP